MWNIAKFYAEQVNFHSGWNHLFFLDLLAVRELFDF